MLKSVRSIAIGLFLAITVSLPVFAQNHPMPRSKNEQPAICTGCPGTNASGQPNDGLPTYPFTGALIDHVGRYVDSSNVQSYQMWSNSYRTARARTILPAFTQRGAAPPRVYIQIGNGVGVYSLDSFFTQRLPGGMVPITRRFAGAGSGREMYLDWDAFVYPEFSASGWQIDGGDFQDPMSKGVPFDVDDRGNVYVATERFGWAIVTDDGRTAGTHLPKVIQFVTKVNPEYTKVLTDPAKVSAGSIVSIKSGGSYYAIVASRDSSLAVFNTTDTSRPTLHGAVRSGDKSYGIRAMARNDEQRRIAYIDGAFKLNVYDYANLVAGTEPVAQYTADSGQFGEAVSMDEQGNIWTVDSSGKIWKLTPSGAGYSKQTFSPFPDRFQPLMMSARNGYMAIGGIDWAASTYDVRVLRIDGAGVTNLNIDNFFRKYYHQAPPSYAQPGSYTAIQAQSADVEIIKWGGKTYLLYSGFGLGDVFELEGGNSINIEVKGAPYGTPNPNAKSTESGPFYGDPVTFVANSSSPAVSYDVNWNFGNPESAANTGRSRTGEDETHQYTGLTSAAAINAVKAVKAQTVQDPNIQAQHNLTLKLPTPRVGVIPGATPVTIAASTTGLEVVAGSSFTDASDGAVEGHVATWNIDGTSTSLKPDQAISVGAVGAHTVQFSAAYGAYDANLAVATPYNAPALSIGYVVKPYKVVINTPTATATDYVFTASADYTSDATILSTLNCTAVWSVDGTAMNSGISTNAAATLNALPALTLPKNHASLADGSVTITLTVNVDPAALSAPAQQYAQAVKSVSYSNPDPVVLDPTGCQNANSPCTLTVGSSTGGSTADWTFSWTLRLNGQIVRTGTGNPYSPSITQAGTYLAEVVAKKGIFEAPASKQFSVAASLCGPLPQAINVGINKVGCTSSCAPGTTIEFAPTFLGYTKQACDSYSWSMGDGTTKTGEVVTHSYGAAGSYTVTLTMSNTGSSTPVVKQTTVTVTSGTTDPPTNTCTAPSGITIHPTCNGSTNCRTTDTVSFIARRNGSSLQTCDNVAWTFGDGTQSSTKSPTKLYSAAGTYTITATVSNANGSAQGTTQLTISDPVSGNCAIAPAIGNFVIEFAGPTTNCRQFNATPCNGGEQVAFTAPNYYYVVGSCDNFEWDFGDGSAKVNGREVSHAFPGGQTYAVKLRVYNNAGSYTYNRNVTVAGTAPTKPVPVLSAGTFPTTGVKGRSITFTATSNLATTTGWTWEFGDGPADTSKASTTGASSTITHTFASTGTYTVKVSARNSEDAATAPSGTAQAQIVIADAPAIPEYKYLIPVAAYTAGQGGSAWRTDVQIYTSDATINPANPLQFDALFKGTTRSLTQEKPTKVYENFLGTYILFNEREDQGPVIITTKNTTVPPQIWTRTYTQTANGTFGQFIPAIRIDNVGGGGATGDSKYYMSGLRHDDRYRTNVGFLNPNAAAITVTVTVYDADKFKKGEFPLTLQPFQLDQFPLKSKVPDLPTNEPFSVKIAVTAPNWVIAYASYIDGLSNDPVYVQAMPESDVASADYKTTILPGIGHTGQWRSDVTIFNPDPDGVMFDLEYYDSTGAKKAEALNVPLDAGKFLQYADLLKQGVLGNVEDGLGMLKVIVKDNHEKYPMTTARTYFDNGANGTYGQGIPAFSPARANVKPGQHAIIAGVRNTAAYRTNIGLVNVSNAAVTAKVTLLDPTTGAAVSTIDYPIQPNQSIVGSFNGWNGVTQGTFKIEANGAVWAFASIIDQQTKDPEYVPGTAIVTP